MPGICFRVLDRPLCFWDDEPERTNIESIEMIDEKYFPSMAEAFRGRIQTERDSEQFLHELIIQYSMSLEALFSFLIAVIQAPSYFYAWMISYKTHELVAAVKRVTSGQELSSPLRFRPINWSSFARFLFSPVDKKLGPNSELYAKAWMRMATDFVDPVRMHAFNRFKHGFSARKGSIKLMTIGNEPKKVDLVGSEFGHHFYELKKIDEENSSNYFLSDRYVHWDPDNIILAIELAGYSIGNVKQIFRAWQEGKELMADFYFLKQAVIDSYIEAPQKVSLTTLSFQKRSVTYPSPPPTKDDLEKQLMARESLGMDNPEST